MENELFHIMDRGVDKRQVFMDDQDYFRFIHDLYEFNDEKPSNSTHFMFYNSPSWDIGCPKLEIRRRKRDCLVKIHAFVLMPNHYHLFISAVVEDGIPKFMKKLNMGYSKYFNEKNERKGALWQGKYKSVPVTGDGHFLYLPYYIHFNPLDLVAPEWRKRNIPNKEKAIEFLKTYRWSSHLDYLGQKNFPSVTDRSFLLKCFGGTEGYSKAFENEMKNFSMENVMSITLE
jgi:putative transposase